MTTSKEQPITRKKQTPQARKSNTDELQKLWLSPNYYILIRKNGECASIWLEGAMGYVIKCSHKTKTGRSLAWKIPRLIADSVRENSYISQLMENEATNAERIDTDNGLMISQAFSNPFRSRVPGVTSSDHAHAPQGPASKLLLVKFSKGNPPSFVCVESEVFRAAPPDAVDAVIEKKWNEIKASMSRVSSRMPCFIPVFSKDEKKRLSDGSVCILSKSTEVEIGIDGWYTHLPSVLFAWASGTLQEAISNGKRGRWQLEAHYTLIESIATGLCAIHKHKMLHADLRPANIMYKNNPQKAQEYVLTDFGSLTPEISEENYGGGEDGRTILRSISNARISLFYAPERRHGFEHEDADIAYIYKDGNRLLIVMGWKVELDTYHENGVLRGEAAKLFASRSHPPPPPPSPSGSKPQEKSGNAEGGKKAGGVYSRLRKGDRLRLREYVFGVESVTTRSVKLQSKSITCTTILCEDVVWKVFSERIVIAIEDFWDEFYGGGQSVRLPLPKIVEIYQWSTATDVYSVGALALYSFYPRSSNGSVQELAKAEKNFSLLLDALSNQFYFRTIWPGLNDFVERLEGQLSRDDLGEVSKVQFAKTVIDWDLPNKKQATIIEVALHVSSNITQTAPGADALLEETFERNTAQFCLFIHFVLACLHRRSSLEKLDANVKYPFCYDRISGNPFDAAAKSVLERATRLKRLSNGWLDQIVCKESEVVPYEPKSDVMIIMENKRLRDGMAASVKKLREIGGSRFSLFGVRKSISEVAELLQTLSENPEASKEPLPLPEKTP